MIYLSFVLLSFFLLLQRGYRHLYILMLLVGIFLCLQSYSPCQWDLPGYEHYFNYQNAKSSLINYFSTFFQSFNAYRIFCLCLISFNIAASACIFLTLPNQYNSLPFWCMISFLLQNYTRQNISDTFTILALLLFVKHIFTPKYSTLFLSLTFFAVGSFLHITGLVVLAITLSSYLLTPFVSSLLFTTQPKYWLFLKDPTRIGLTKIAIVPFIFGLVSFVVIFTFNLSDFGQGYFKSLIYLDTGFFHISLANTASIIFECLFSLLVFYRLRLLLPSAPKYYSFILVFILSFLSLRLFLLLSLNDYLFYGRTSVLYLVALLFSITLNPVSNAVTISTNYAPSQLANISSQIFQKPGIRFSPTIFTSLPTVLYLYTCLKCYNFYFNLNSSLSCI